VTDNPIMALPPGLRGKVTAYVSAKVEEAEVKAERERRLAESTNAECSRLAKRVESQSDVIRQQRMDLLDNEMYIDYLAAQMMLFRVPRESYAAIKQKGRAYVDDLMSEAIDMKVDREAYDEEMDCRNFRYAFPGDEALPEF
jgi:hypothetical protein